MQKIYSLLCGIFLFLCFSLSAQSPNDPALTEHIDLSYYTGAGFDSAYHKLNLILPKEIEAPPLLLWIGGGAWSYVDRKMELDVARKFAEQGVAVAAIGHRLSPATWKDPKLDKGIQHPEHIKDVARAFKWLVDHADEYGYQADRIFVGGFSSGGHLAALLSTDKTYLQAVGLSTKNIRGVIPIGGAYDIADYHRTFLNGSRSELAELHVEAVFGSSAEDFRLASPATYVDSLATPMLLISENNTYNYTRIFEDRIRNAGFRDIQVLHIQNIGHRDLWRNLSFETQSPYRDYILSFIKRLST